MTKIDIGRVQKTKPYLFADAVELWVAFTDQQHASKTDVLSLMQQSTHSAEDLLELEEVDLDDNEWPDHVHEAEISSREQGYVDDCFGQLEYRQIAFGEAYPFEFAQGSIRLKANLTGAHSLYLFLLAASRTRTFKDNKGIVQRISDKFEEVSKFVLVGMMNEDAEVVLFGPNQADRTQRFGSNLQAALPLLADFMGMVMAPDWEAADEAPQGDAGLDIIGVQSLDDSQGGWLVFLGQCASIEEEKNWKSKRSQADITYHASRFHHTVAAIPLLFVPVCFRRPDGKWAKKSSTDKVILLDRLRITKMINNVEDAINISKTTLQSEGIFE